MGFTHRMTSVQGWIYSFSKLVVWMSYMWQWTRVVENADERKVVVRLVLTELAQSLLVLTELAQSFRKR